MRETIDILSRKQQCTRVRNKKKGPAKQGLFGINGIYVCARNAFIIKAPLW
jgi:hypothetical protein